MDPLQENSSFSGTFVSSGQPTTTAAPVTAAPAKRQRPISVDLEAERLAAQDESWKREYDERLNAWKADAAVRRDASELQRSQWEEIRKSEPELPSAGFTTSSLASSFADAREIASIERPEALPKPVETPARSTSGEHGSQGWEKVQAPSVASSFPSLPSHPHEQPPPSQRKQPHQSALTFPAVAPPSVTLSIFDPSLSKRGRALALVSALAINLLLPFINGVMLGFGEIFAKNLLGWRGWTNVASFVGLRKPTPAPKPATVYIR